MKKIFNYLTIVAVAAFAASCNTNYDPIFDDADAFVAFDKSAMSCQETAKEISVPVTLASVAGIATTISYEAVDGSAKAGVNYDLADGTGTLTFSKEGRTQYIKVKIYDPEVTYTEAGEREGGIYTGDLKFTLKFKSTGDVNSSADNSCTITIQDLDHPLSAILGDWTFEGKSQGAMSSWACELRKDADDDHMVWFYDIVNLTAIAWAGWDISYYGNVTMDEKNRPAVINIPLGQESEYIYKSTGTPVTLCAADADFNYIYDSGSVSATIVYDDADHAIGIVFDLDGSPAGEGAGLVAYIVGAGWLNNVYPPYTGTKD